MGAKNSSKSREQKKKADIRNWFAPSLIKLQIDIAE